MPTSLAGPNQVDGWMWAPTGATTLTTGQYAFRSLHPGGLNFVFGDGSVRFIKNSIDMGNFATLTYPSPGTAVSVPGSRMGAYRALSTRASGEIISSDSY